MRINYGLTIVLFVLLVIFGIARASQQHLWNDEFYSLISSTLGTSYTKALAGGIGEGNNSPLFYVLQKIQCDLFSYHPPEDWIKGKWSGSYSYSQVFLRVQPVLCLAFGLSALFYFFTSRFSVFAGFYALIVALSSSMVWGHWTEARPYALWFALSMAQMLLVLEIVSSKEKPKEKLVCWFAGIQIFLAFTATISIGQIMVASCMVWLSGHRQWKSYIFMALVPLVICLFYYHMAPKYDFYFVDGPLALINANIPKDRLFIFLMFAGVFVWKSGGKINPWMQMEGIYLIFSVLLLAFFSSVLFKFKLDDAHKGFQISSRYFMSLTPLNIIGTTLFSVYLFRSMQTRVTKVLILLILTGLLVFRIHKTNELFVLPRVQFTQLFSVDTSPIVIYDNLKIGEKIS